MTYQPDLTSCVHWSKKLVVVCLCLAVCPMVMAKSLHDAAWQGDLDKVTRLIEQGMDVNEHGMGGDTPLHKAAKGGHLDVVKLLITKGANVNAKSDNGNTPLHSAASLGHLKVVEFLISKGADVNAEESNYGATPLHSAARGGNASVVEFLIEQGADVNALTNDGRTPLDMAFASGHQETVDLLRRYGGFRQARRGSRQARKCITAKDIETINKGIVKRAFHIKGRNAKIFLAVDPRLLTLEGHFALLMEQDIDEIRVWKFKQPPGLGAAVPFVNGCAAEGYGEPDMFEKLKLMQEVVVSIDKYGVDHDMVRDKIGRLLLPESPTATPEVLETQTDKIISRVRAIVEHG